MQNRILSQRSTQQLITKSKFAYITILTGALVFASVAHTDSESEETNEKNQTTLETRQEAQDTSVNNNRPLQEFTPSEEVSIDKPVAFPVDI